MVGELSGENVQHSGRKKGAVQWDNELYEKMEEKEQQEELKWIQDEVEKAIDGKVVEETKEVRVESNTGGAVQWDDSWWETVELQDLQKKKKVIQEEVKKAMDEGKTKDDDWSKFCEDVNSTFMDDMLEELSEMAKDSNEIADAVEKAVNAATERLDSKVTNQVEQAFKVASDEVAQKEVADKLKETVKKSQERVDSKKMADKLKDAVNKAQETVDSQEFADKVKEAVDKA